MAPREWRCWADATPSALDSEWGRGVLDAEKMGDRACVVAEFPRQAALDPAEASPVAAEAG